MDLVATNGLAAPRAGKNLGKFSAVEIFRCSDAVK
jgi:hypothetical protein